MLDRETTTQSTELRVRIPALRAALQQARVAERAQVDRRPVHTEGVACAKVDTMRALKAYVGAIEALSWPVPRALRWEIDLRTKARH